VHKGFETLDMNVLEARAHRWRFNLVTGATTEESLTDRCAEFPMVNGRHAGRHHRYIYEARCTHGLFAFDALIKRDVDAGTETLIEFDPGVFVSETVMAPRNGSTAEDDGYLVTFTSNMNTNESHCMILDAADPTSGPVAQIRLPERISSGTHSTWAPLSDLG
jgi:carotenoid cleavage dioxygenase